MNNKLKKLKKEGLIKFKEGQATGIRDFFEQLIKSQFEKNEDAIKSMHKALMKYVMSDNIVFPVRLYGSVNNKKKDYEKLRRGFLSVFPDGKRMVFCDNTFAMPFAALKLHGETYTYEELVEYMDQPNVLCGFGSTKEEREIAFYFCKNENRINLNSAGWYLAHIIPVGKGYEKGSISKIIPNPDRTEWEVSDDKVRYVSESLPNDIINALRAHFLRLVHPLNSFVVPKRNLLEYEGKNIGEEEELIDTVKEYIKEKFSKEYSELLKLVQISETNLYRRQEFRIGSIIWSNSESAINKIRRGSKSKSQIIYKQRKGNNSNKNTHDIFDINEVERLESALRSVGKSVFLKLYPLLKKNIDITIKEVYRMYPDYKKYKLGSQKSRLSTSRTIFKEGLVNEALEIIQNSSNMNKEDILRAKEFLDMQSSQG